MAKVIIFVLLTQARGQPGMLPLLITLPVQNSCSLRKDQTWASRFQVSRFRVVMWDRGMGIHREAKGLSRNLGEKHSHCGNFKSLFHLLLPFPLCWGHRSHVAWGSLTNWHLKKVVGKEGRRGNLRSPFLLPFATLALLGNWALMPGVWEGRGVPLTPESDLLQGDACAGPRGGRDTHTSCPHRPDVRSALGTFVVFPSFIPKPLAP